MAFKSITLEHPFLKTAIQLEVEYTELDGEITVINLINVKYQRAYHNESVFSDAQVIKAIKES